MKALKYLVGITLFLALATSVWSQSGMVIGGQNNGTILPGQ